MNNGTTRSLSLLEASNQLEIEQQQLTMKIETVGAPLHSHRSARS